MKVKTPWLKRIGAAMLCLCMLCSVLLGGVVVPTKAAAGETPPTAFSVNFSNLAALVEDAQYDANGLYSSKYNDDAINDWANTYFDIYMTTQGSATAERLYLGQSSYAFIADRSEQSQWGGEHSWVIDKTGYLIHNVTKQGGEVLRKGEQMVLKTATGAQATLQNFEATVVFNTVANGRGAVALSFHEDINDPGHLVNNQKPAKSDAVIIGRNSDTDDDYVLVRKIGSDHSKKDLSNQSFSDNKTSYNTDLVKSVKLSSKLADNTDYTLYVKVLGGKATVTISNAGGTVYNGEFDVTDSVGTISVGATNANRSFKSIEVKELNAAGEQVDFGSEHPNVSKFVYSFNNLVKVNDGTVDGNRKYPNGKTWFHMHDEAGNHPDAVAEIQYLLRERFDEYMDAQGVLTKTDFALVPNAGTGHGTQDGRDNGGFWQLWDGWIQRKTYGVTWKQNMRLVSSMVPKNEITGEPYTMTNFETSFTARFEKAMGTHGNIANSDHTQSTIVLGFRQGESGHYVVSENKVRNDQVYIAITQSGITVAGGDNIPNDAEINKALYNSDATYSFKDYTPADNAVFQVNVRVIGNTIWLKVATNEGTVLFDNFAGGKDAAVVLDCGNRICDGAIAYGIGEFDASINDIKLTRLDVNGKPIDLTVTHNGTAAEEFAVDFAELAAMVNPADFVDGVYTPMADDLTANQWVNARFDFVHTRGGRDYPPRAYLGQDSQAFDYDDITQYGGIHRWVVAKGGYLQHTVTRQGGEMLRKGEQMVLKTANGAQAQLENFEATVVFNTMENGCGAIALSFHEKVAGRLVNNINADRTTSNAVIIGNGAGYNSATGTDGIMIRKHGSPHSDRNIVDTAEGLVASERFAQAFAANTDYVLYVKVLNGTVTVKVTSVDGATVFYNKTFANAVDSYNGTISVGATNANRAFKSIVVRELDANGAYVPFGTATTNVSTFTENFNNLWPYNGKYAGSTTNNTDQGYFDTTWGTANQAAVTEIAKVLNLKFNEYLDFYGQYSTPNFTNADISYGDENASFRELLGNHTLQRIATIKWNRNMRFISSLVPKSGRTGEELKMTNMEASFGIYWDTATTITSKQDMNNNTAPGTVIFGFRQQKPGAFTVADGKLRQDTAFVVISQTGFTVMGGNECEGDHPGLFNDEADEYSFFDYNTGYQTASNAAFTVKIRVVGDDVKLQIAKSGADIFNNFENGAQKDVVINAGGFVEEGTVAFAIGERKAGLRNISLTRLDENGTPIDIDPYVESEVENIDVEQFHFDASIGDYTGDSATLDTQADALKVLKTKFMHYFVHDDIYDDFPWYGNAGGNDGCGNWQLENNAWLSRINVKNGGERLRQINALIPKDANGNAAQTENLIAEFDYRFDNENSTALFGFRQNNPAKFINGTAKMNQEQVLIAVSKTALSVKSGTEITTEEFYSEKATYEALAVQLKDVPNEIHVYVKAVGNSCTVILSTLDGKVLAKNVFSVTNNGIGYMALGVAAGEGSFGDVTITRLNDVGMPVDFTVLDYQDKIYDDGIVRFSADFGGLASLAEDFAKGVYVPTATDRTINHWFDSRFSLYFNLNYRNSIHEKKFAGEASTVYDPDDSKNDATWRGGEVYWQLDQKGYLTHYAGGTGWEMMRKIQLLTLKAPDGNAATVKNFEATFTVHDEKQAQGAVLLSFRNDKADTISPTSENLYANQQLLAIGYDGNGNAGMNLGGGAAELADTYKAFKRSLDELKGVTDYKVYVKVLGDDIIVKITSLDDASVYYDNSDAPQKAVMKDAGYIMLGVSNSTKSLVDLTVTELDDNGNAIDFGTNTGKGNIFEFSVTDAVEYRNGVYENDKAWIDFVGDEADPESAVTSKMISLLNSKFALYYNLQGTYQQTEAGLKETYTGQTGDFAYLGRLYANKWLQRLVAQAHGKQTMRLITGMVPRSTNTGEELKMKNFETSFQFRFESETYHQEAAILGFRQQTPGKFVDNYFKVNQEQGLVAITRHGISVAAGEDIFSGQKLTEDGQETHQSLDGDLYDGAQAISFDDPATEDVTEMLPQVITVKVRVVNDKLWLTVLDDAGTAVLFDNNGLPFDIDYDKDGYLAYGFGNGQAGIANIKLARLDENGKQIDINNAASFVDAQWDTTAARYSQIMGSVKKDIVTALDYYYSSLKAGSTTVVKETVDVHWALNNNGILMRHSDLSDSATSNIATMKWNLFEEKETIQNYDAVFKLQLDAAQQGTFWVVSGQTDKANIGKITATDGDTDYIHGQMAVGFSVGGDITIATGNGNAVELAGPTLGTPDGVYTLRVRVSNGLLEVYVNGTARASRRLDASAAGDGYLYYGYSGAQLGIAEVTVTRLNEQGVAVDFTTEYTDVEDVADRTVDKGATMSELELPTTLKVYKGTVEETSNVYWDCSGVDFNTEGEYYVIGYLENTNGIRAVVKVQVGKYDPENTVLYTFNDGNILDQMDTYFLPEGSAGNQPAIHVKDTENDNWYVSDGGLRTKRNAYYRSKAEIMEGVEIEGVTYQNPDQTFATYQSNIAIAVLKTQTYKNFILDIDYKARGTWNFVGFGADATDANSVFGSQDNGGTAFFVTADSGATAGVSTWANANCWNTKSSLKPYDISSGNGMHHMQIIVSDGTAYFYLDDIASPVIMQLPETYDGGYIYLGLNATDSYFDNLKIVDLDAKEIEITELKNVVDDITIDRAKGESLSLPEKVIGVDKDGYEYFLPLEWESEDYRSGKSGDYAFTPAPRLHNTSFKGNVTVLVKNRINGDYDETASVKYYFDHANDLLDFNSYYSEPLDSKKVPSSWKEDEWGPKYNAHDGYLTHSENPLSRWRVTENGATTVRSDGNGGWGVWKLFTNLETMTLKEELNLNLTSYKLEMDFYYAPNDWWYTYMLFGVQDPSKFTGKATIKSGKEFRFYAHESAREGGVYYWVEDGLMNLTGALISGGERVWLHNNSDYIYNNPGWPGAFERDGKHHLTVYVFDQLAFLQVDNSGYIEIALTPYAIGGLAGFGSHGNATTISSFQLTAIDKDTFDAVNDTCDTVPLATAKRGWAPELSYDDFNAWKPSEEDLEYDWTEHITNY